MKNVIVSFLIVTLGGLIFGASMAVVVERSQIKQGFMVHDGTIYRITKMEQQP